MTCPTFLQPKRRSPRQVDLTYLPPALNLAAGEMSSGVQWSSPQLSNILSSIFQTQTAHESFSFSQSSH